jgi:hypothetical protein
MQHFGEADYEIEKAIADYHGAPHIAKNCECWEGYKRVPGTKPCAPGSCEKCDSNSKKESSQGDKPSPHAAQEVFDALVTGDKDSAKELLGHTDCPEGCEVHAEGKCNHGYMSAGRTRVRYLVDPSDLQKEAKDWYKKIWDNVNPTNPEGFLGEFLHQIGPNEDKPYSQVLQEEAQKVKEEAAKTMQEGKNWLQHTTDPSASSLDPYSLPSKGVSNKVIDSLGGIDAFGFNPINRAKPNPQDSPSYGEKNLPASTWEDPSDSPR